MKASWIEDDLANDWLLLPAERNSLPVRQGAIRLGFALQLKFFQLEGRFPDGPAELPHQIVQFIAEQLDIPIAVWPEYPWGGRSATYHRSKIRKWFGFRASTRSDHRVLENWLLTDRLDQ